MGVMWPPPYYLLRDRIPFFLTILYIYRNKIPQKYRDYAGLGLLAVTSLCLGLSIPVWLNGWNFKPFFGFRWSVPSPIEWSLLIITLTIKLYHRGIAIFPAYYLSLITALGGGWLYEFIPLLFQGHFNALVFFKANAVKVFFFEFQLLCLPILVYIIKTTKQYQQSRLLIPAGLFFLVYSVLTPVLNQFVRTNLLYTYGWYIRLPAILFLFILVNGIKGEKLHE